MSLVHLDGMEVSVQRRFHQKTKNLILEGPLSENPPLLTYRSPVFQTDFLEILKQPERRNQQAGRLSRSPAQYATVNAFVRLRIVDPGALTGQAGQLQGGLIAAKGGEGATFPAAEQITLVPAAGGGAYTPGGVIPSFDRQAFVANAELRLPTLVEPWAVSDQVYVACQLTIDVQDGVLNPAPVNPVIVVEFEVLTVAAGLQAGFG